MIRLFFIFLYFLISGEIISRLADHYLHIDINVNEKLIDQKIDYTIEKNKLYLLGDSQVLGPGINKKERLAFSLSQLEGYSLVNLARTGQVYSDFIKDIKNIENSMEERDIILMGVNFRSINFKKNSVSSLLKPFDKKTEFIENKDLQLNSLDIFNTIKLESVLLRFLRTNIKNILLQRGIMLPFGFFYKLHNNHSDNEKIKEIYAGLKYIDTLVELKKIHVYIYILPDFNLINQKKYFERFISLYKNNNYKNVTVLNGFDDFIFDKNNNYSLSIMDSHPNGDAHQIIAKKIIKIINRDLNDKKIKKMNN